jgi:DNA-binding NarL/FixJ family response regulator
MTNTTILLVDDHALIRQGCRRIIERYGNIAIVGEAETGAVALEKIEELKPNLVLMDISLPDVGGIEVTRQIKSRFPKTRVIILSLHTHETYVYQALTAGAAAYVVKQGGERELEGALAAVTAGNVYLSPLVSQTIVDVYLKYAPREMGLEDSPLTNKEREVLVLLTQGLTSKEAAQRLQLSPQTIDVHRKNIMKKLDIHNVPGLMRWALRSGIISAEA